MPPVPVHEDALVHEFLAASPARQAQILSAWGLPPASALILVNACESRCFFCAGPGTIAVPAADITPRQRILDFFGQASPEQGRLIIAGNEPLLHPDVDLAFELAAAAGFAPIQLMTSALSLEPARLRRFVAQGLRELVVPIYSAEASLHDEISGRPAFQQLVEGLDLAHALGLRLHLHTLALRRTLAGLPALARLCEQRWGARLAVAPLRDKALFRFADEALPLDELRLALAALPVSRLGLPLCVGRALPQSEALAIEVYFRTQRRGYAAACEGCADRPACPGVVEAALCAWGERGLEPR